ncbi:MAG: diguanylate cyclase [Tepidisphaera sp.]|jgi:two-component system, cell cycle response regulator
MQTPQATPMIPAQSDEQRPLALVIDDSLDVHRLLAARLKQEEIDLICTADPREGLTRAAAVPPAVILLDLDMPGMDGFEVLRALKDNPATHHVPVIILSGMAGMQDKVTAFELGAIDYVVKPFEFTELRVRLRSALRVHRLLSLLASRAQLDGLTGLWNRAYFDHRLSEEASKSTRHSRPFSIAIADADNFKSINDTFGHPAGDAVLQGLAKILRRECRQSDIVCRYGGEEFVILMPDTTAIDAAAVCERIRQSVEQAAWPRHPERKVTISMGVAGVNGATALQPAAWLETADRNLYTSKRSGRNTVTTTDLTITPPPIAPSNPSAAAA